MKNSISILFATMNHINTVLLLKSIERQLEEDTNFDTLLHVYIIDKTENQLIKDYANSLNLSYEVFIIKSKQISILESKHHHIFERSNCTLQSDSIQRARIQQQIYIVDNYNKFVDSIVWQIDDDMLFAEGTIVNNEFITNYSRNYFSRLLNFYTKHKNIDALILPSTYAPPIPSLLYSETQLRDFFYGEQLDQVNTSFYEYHDYYNRNRSDNTYSIFLSHLSKKQDKNKIVKDILIGKPITKATYTIPNEEVIIPQKSSLLRGGNFIVFNIEIFKIPHLGFKENHHTSVRRSDMIHAHLLDAIGFNIRDLNDFTLVHNRSFEGVNFENCIKKYYSDMIGSLVVQYLYKGNTQFENRYLFYKSHIKRIIKLIQNNVDIKLFLEELKQLEELEEKINAFDKDNFINSLYKFKELKSRLIKELCK
jgi:hypothetical protein